MLLTYLTAAIAGYVLAKKRFPSRAFIFGLLVCAMALPKQVIGALAAIPIITIFLVFQKYFTKGITMGAVKG